MLTASLTVDLSYERDPFDSEPFDQDKHDRKQLCGLGYAPDGTRVIVLIGNRKWPPGPGALIELRAHAERLNLDLRGTSLDAIEAWHRALAPSVDEDEVAS